MSFARVVGVLAASLVCGACFTVPDGKFACDDDHGCPRGYACGADGRCWKDGCGVSCDDASIDAGMDSAIEPPPDANAPDGATDAGMDSTIDPPPDAPDGATLPEGLVLWFPFDEGAGTETADTVGARDATLSAGISWAPGIRGSGLECTTGEFVELADVDFLDSMHEGSITVWVKPLSLGWGIIFAADPGGCADNIWLGFDRLAGGSITAGHAQWCLDIDAKGDETYQLDSWYHLAYVVTDSMTVMYIDGDPVSLVYQLGDASNPIFFDDRAAGTTRYSIGAGVDNGMAFIGALDEFRIYDHALTAAEVAADMSYR